MKLMTGSIAVVLGAGMGTLISREVATSFAETTTLTNLLGATIGGLIGGVVAWSGSDVPHFLHGVSRAWKEIVEWRPNWMAAEKRARNNADTILGGLSSLLLVGWLLWSLVFPDKFSEIDWMRTTLIFLGGVVVVSAFAGIGGLIGFVSGVFATKENDSPERVSLDSQPHSELWLFNPIVLPLIGGLVGFAFNRVLIFLHWVVTSVLIKPYILIPLCIAGALCVLYSLRHFFRKAFEYVNTYQRRCAFFSAALGVFGASLTGYSVIVGGILGLVTFLGLWMSSKMVIRKASL